MSDQATMEQPKTLTGEERAARPWLKYRLRPVAANGSIPGRHEQLCKDGKVRSYPAGTVCESQEDLAERWPEKFEVVREEAIPTDPSQVRVPAGYKLVKADEPQVVAPAGSSPAPASALITPARFTRETLAVLSLDELLRTAADEEVDVKGFAKDKDRVIRALLNK